MKFTKRILVAVMTLALALSLALPAIAAVNWDEFYIFTQPQGMTIPYGDSFTLSVEVNVPEGVDELVYKWYRVAEPQPVAYLIRNPQTGKRTFNLQLDPSSGEYPPSSEFGGQFGMWDYQFRITARERNEAGYLHSEKTLTSDIVRVVAEYDVAIDMDVVTQPQNLSVKNGDDITLSVGVNVPEGIELAYQWYRGSSLIEGAISPELRLGCKSSHYPAAAYSEDYHCEITAYEKDSGGSVIATRTVRSKSARVSVTKNGWDKLYDVTVGPFVQAFGGTVATVMMTFGILIPVFPLIFVFYLLYCFIQGIQGLF